MLIFASLNNFLISIPPLQEYRRGLSLKELCMKLRSFAIAVLLIVPCLAVLIVPFYNRIEPAWNGIPFFYWYQLAWAPLSAISLGIAYAVNSRGDNK